MGWNGLIMMRIREEIKPPNERDESLLTGLRSQFQSQMYFLSMGPRMPLPSQEPLPGDPPEGPVDYTTESGNIPFIGGFSWRGVGAFVLLVVSLLKFSGNDRLF